jgi:hypothetical protein
MYLRRLRVLGIVKRGEEKAIYRDPRICLSVYWNSDAAGCTV